jgi:XTP/dITP diphosphohydrolase
MKIYFLTTNKGKLREAELAMQPLGIQVESYPIEINEPSEGTIEEVALAKLKQALEYLKSDDQGKTWEDRILVVDDAGIFFEAYHEFPGIFTKRLFHSIGYKGMMKLLDGESRRAYFEGALAVYRLGEIKTFKAITPGRIALETSVAPQNEGFPYNVLFIPDGDHRVLAEMNEEERLSYSYRKKAFDRLGIWLID